MVAKIAHSKFENVRIDHLRVNAPTIFCFALVVYWVRFTSIQSVYSGANGGSAFGGPF
jgi:hypothetical protein